jgi:ornithine decarboxylase
MNLLGRYAGCRALVEKHRHNEPIRCVYPAVLKRTASEFLAAFPGDVLYAVKANPNDLVLHALYDGGIRHFDTASLNEIKRISELFPDATCYFMAPAKLVGAAAAAFHDFGVRHFVVDHDSELDRLLEFADQHTTLHVRLKAENADAVYELSSKFGVDFDNAVHLIQRIKQAGVGLGISFHVGSLCLSANAYVEAIDHAKKIAKMAGVTPEYLDIGGGSPTIYPLIQAQQPLDFFPAINAELAKFSPPGETTYLCEPGRSLVADGQSLLVQVISIKDDLVFLNDGIYGNFNELNLSADTVTYPSHVIRLNGTAEARTRPFRISGPTCDTLDVLPMTFDLPVDIAVGDWIELTMAGAYTNTLQTAFNGFGFDNWAIIDGEPPR